VLKMALIILWVSALLIILGISGLCLLIFRLDIKATTSHGSPLHRLKPILESKPLIFHNIKFDLQSLATIGVHPTAEQRLFCTQQIAHMVNEEWFSKALDSLSKNLLGDQKAKQKSLNGLMLLAGIVFLLILWMSMLGMMLS
jgi:DNA polymerase I-like protein with 3'-5' exonuclease and polymerase domains